VPWETNGPGRRIELIMDMFIFPFILSVRAAISFLLLLQAIQSQLTTICGNYDSRHSTCIPLDGLLLLDVHYQLFGTFLMVNTTLDLHCTYHSI
jgi:hypothetical protein